MKTITVLFILNLYNIGVFAQDNNPTTITFCSKFGQGKASVIKLTTDELDRCDLKVVPSDTNLTVMSFTLTLFSKKDNRPSEIKVNGNTIPPNIQKQIIFETQKFLIEYIQTNDASGKSRLLNALTVNIE